MWRWREPLEKKCESLNKLREAPWQKLVRKLNSVNSRSDLEEDPKPQMMVQSANTLASALWDPKQKTLQNSELINGCCFKPTPQICANSRKPIFRIGTHFFKQPNSKINDTCSPLSFPYGSVSKESACKAGDPGSIPGMERSPGEGNGNPLQYSCLENSVDRGAWRATVHGVARVGHDLETEPTPSS